MKKVFLLIVCCSVVSLVFPKVELASDGKLRYYEADEEVFFVNNSSNSTLRITMGRMEQKSYDSDQRLLETVTWSDDSSTIEKIKEYSYFDNSFLLESTTTDNFVTMKRFEDFYDKSGNIITQNEYILFQEGEDRLFSFELASTITNVYDKKNNKILSMIECKDTAIPTEKIEYRYTVEDIPPNTNFYKDEVLQKSLNYTSSGDWIESMYFAGDMVIKTFYENSIAVKEEVFKNEHKIREKQL